MKILVVGASGMIGGEALIQCLANPHVSQVVAFVRRDLPADVSNHPKLQSVLIKDFAKWPQDVLQAHSDAAGMIWAMGSYRGSVTADLEYPLAFIEGMGSVLEAKPSRPRFRHVQLSGKFVRQDQDANLWFNEKPRKLKGLLDGKALAFAENHAAVWQTFVIKPGGVVPRKLAGNGVLGVVTSLAALTGENRCVRIQELGVFMTYLAIDGGGEEPLTEHERIVRRGRELLDSNEGDFKP